MLILIDFSNALNIVDHDLLIAHLPNANVSGSALKFHGIRSSQKSVRVGRTNSDWQDMKVGMPHGRR